MTVCGPSLQAVLVNLLLVAMLLPAGGWSQDAVSGASPVRGERPQGYLATDEVPDGIALLPPPPVPGSTAHEIDESLNRAALELRDTPRWELAAQDAIPNPGWAFSCALGIPLSAEQTPALFNLLMRSGSDAGAAVSPAKRHYQRKRPFLVNDQPICTPGSAESTARDGSYPSGHTALGWTWALILTSLAPERTDRILARGYEYGQSRAVCNVHWQSDIDQGRMIGSALFARLQANDTFREDLDTAREEIAAIRVKNLQPGRKCEAEMRTLQ